MSKHEMKVLSIISFFIVFGFMLIRGSVFGSSGISPNTLHAPKMEDATIPDVVKQGEAMHFPDIKSISIVTYHYIYGENEKPQEGVTKYQYGLEIYTFNRRYYFGHNTKLLFKGKPVSWEECKEILMKKNLTATLHYIAEGPFNIPNLNFSEPE